MKKVTEVKKATSLKDLHSSMVPQGSSALTTEEETCDDPVTSLSFGSGANSDVGKMTKVNIEDSGKGDLAKTNNGDKGNLANSNDEGDSVKTNNERIGTGAIGDVEICCKGDIGSKAVKGKSKLNKQACDQSVEVNVDADGKMEVEEQIVDGDMTVENKGATNSNGKLESRADKESEKAVVKPKMVYFFERGDSLKRENSDENANNLGAVKEKQETDASRRGVKRSADKHVSHPVPFSIDKTSFFLFMTLSLRQATYEFLKTLFIITSWD